MTMRLLLSVLSALAAFTMFSREGEAQHLPRRFKAAPPADFYAAPTFANTRSPSLQRGSECQLSPLATGIIGAIAGGFGGWLFYQVALGIWSTETDARARNIRTVLVLGGAFVGAVAVLNDRAKTCGDA